MLQSFKIKYLFVVFVIVCLLEACSQKKCEQKPSIRECFRFMGAYQRDGIMNNFTRLYYHVENHEELCLDQVDFVAELRKVIKEKGKNGIDDTIRSVAFVRDPRIGFDSEVRCTKEEYHQNVIVEFELSEDNITILNVAVGSGLKEPILVDTQALKDTLIDINNTYILVAPYVEND